MASHRVDRVLEHVDTSMSQLKTSMRGMPIAAQGFKAQHDELARAIAALTVALSDARSAVR